MVFLPLRQLTEVSGQTRPLQKMASNAGISIYGHFRKLTPVKIGQHNGYSKGNRPKNPVDWTS
jgi:hypothetical protein